MRNAEQKMNTLNIDSRRRNCISFRVPRSAFLVLLLLLLTGCGTATSHGKGTALDHIDLINMTDDMAAKIAASPDVQAAIAANGPMKIVVMPVENQMTGEILPRGPAMTFVSRIRALLARKNSEDRFIWIANKDAYRAMQARELEPGTDLGPDPSTTNPEYSLNAIFSSLTKENADRRSSYYLCEYQLTSLKDRTILWTDKYELKKIAVKGYLD
jgi:hypothetical protein